MKRFKKIYIEITNICNKDCSFCIKSNREKRELSLKEFESIIKEIKTYTDYIYLHVKGEPLLHSNFKEILEICDQYNIMVNITTNGTLIYKQIDAILNSNCIRQINISTHSYETLEEIYKIFECVDKILKNKSIYIVYRYWTLKDSIITYNNAVIKSIIDYYNLNEGFQKKLYEDSNIKLHKFLYVNKDYKFEWPSLDSDYYCSNGYCLGLKSHIAILSNGDVVPCCLDGEGIIKLGNIFKESLEKILDKEKTNQIIRGFMNNMRIEELCKHCSFNK